MIQRTTHQGTQTAGQETPKKADSHSGRSQTKEQPGSSSIKANICVSTQICASDFEQAACLVVARN